MLSAQSKQVLIVLPDDRAFLDEIRSSLQIEKFIRFDAINTVTKYEQIKEAKKVELRERSAAARLFLEESLKQSTIYVNGDRVQSSAKDVSSRINEALGKLVSTVYHKLSYIDTAMGEADIRKLFQFFSNRNCTMPIAICFDDGTGPDTFFQAFLHVLNVCADGIQIDIRIGSIIVFHHFLHF